MINIQVDNKKFLYQVVLFVILSNLLVYLFSQPEEKQNDVNEDLKNYQSVVAKLRLYVPFETMKKIELWDPREKVLLKDVYLIESKNEKNTLNTEDSEYIIKIQQKDLTQYLKLKNHFLDAYPMGTTPNITTHKKRPYYEMVF